jgi:hypothetical protein
MMKILRYGFYGLVMTLLCISAVRAADVGQSGRFQQQTATIVLPSHHLKICHGPFCP